MIRRLYEEDRSKLLAYLYQEMSYNIFIIGDVESIGFDKEWQTLYGEFDDKGEYLSVLLFYRNNSVYYSHNEVFNVDFLELIYKEGPSYISGKEVLMNLIFPYLDGYKSQLEHFARATKIETNKSFNYETKLLTTKEDFSLLYDLLYTVKEFGIFKETREHFIEGKLNSLEMSTVLGIIRDGIIVSTAATTAETTKNSMIVGVATHADYRKKGRTMSIF